MQATQPSPQPTPDAKKLALTSLISGFLAWGFLLLANVFLKNGVWTAMGGPGATPVIFFIPMLVCFVLAIALPLTAIVRGRRALQIAGEANLPVKLMAWIGISVGALFYLAVIIALGSILFRL